ncbi:MAG: hypothetical protein RLZZ546_2775 [Bacteroidota bacterium]|jgi:hypothetical protein
MTNKLNVSDLVTKGLIYLVSFWICVALLTQSYFIYLNVSGNTERAGELRDDFQKKFDGNYSSDSRNLYHIEEEELWIDGVTNQVKIGKLAGNRNLEFGVRNILEEYVQEKGYGLNETSNKKIKVEIIYLDVLTTKTNISVFHRDNAEVVIRLRGTLYKDGKKEKEVMVEESSSEISMSTLIVDGGGKFNQTSLSNALKKGCEQIITKLLG